MRKTRKTPKAPRVLAYMVVTTKTNLKDSYTAFLAGDDDAEREARELYKAMQERDDIYTAHLAVVIDSTDY